VTSDPVAYPLAFTPQLQCTHRLQRGPENSKQQINLLFAQLFRDEIDQKNQKLINSRSGKLWQKINLQQKLTGSNFVSNVT